MKSRNYLTTLLWTLPVLLQAVILLPRPANNLESGGGEEGLAGQNENSAAVESEEAQTARSQPWGDIVLIMSNWGWALGRKKTDLKTSRRIQTSSKQQLLKIWIQQNQPEDTVLWWHFTVFFPLPGPVLRFLEIIWDSFLTLLPIQKAFKPFVYSLLIKRIQSWILDLPSFWERH